MHNYRPPTSAPIDVVNNARRQLVGKDIPNLGEGKLHGSCVDSQHGPLYFQPTNVQGAIVPGRNIKVQIIRRVAQKPLDDRTHRVTRQLLKIIQNKQ